MEIYLIRHGEAFSSASEYFDIEKNTMNPPLTPAGQEQADKLARRLQPIHFDHIYCSDLERALQTATALKSGRDVNMTALKGFREIDMGDIYLKSWDEFPAEYARWATHAEDTPYPNGENGQDVWSRCMVEIRDILEKPYERVAIVCHGGTIRSIVSGVLGLPQEKRFYLGFPPINCSISILVHHDKFYVHSFNDHAHLTERF